MIALREAPGDLKFYSLTNADMNAKG